MSQDFLATKFHDQKIQSIIQATGQLNDKFPVLLMPLRLETRYMTVDRPVSPTLNFDYKILYDLVGIEYLFEKIVPVNKLGLQEATVIASEIKEEVTKLAASFNGARSLPYPEDTWWEKHLGNINKASKAFKDNLRKIRPIPPGDLRKVKELQSMIREAQMQLTALAVNNIKNNDFDLASGFINQLNLLDDAFENLATHSLAYSNATKQHIFDYIEGRYEYLLDKIGSIEDSMGKYMLANTTQIERINDFPSLLHYRLTQVQNNINTLKSDYKKAEYTNTLQNQIRPRTEELTAALTGRVVPRLEYLRELKTVYAQELTYHATVIQYALKQIMDNGLESYADIKATRVRLYELMRKLRAKGHDIIVGNESEIQTLRTRWSKVDNLLVQYTGMVGQVTVNGQYEEMGQSRCISHIHENYRIDLNGLRKEVPITEAFIQNNDFLESARSYLMIVQKIQEIAGNVYGLIQMTSISKSKLANASESIADFEGEFATLTLKTTIIPEKYYKNIHSLYAGLKQSVQQLNAKVQGSATLVQPMSAINASIALCDASLGNLASDITDEKDPFYDDFRKKFIFALPTETSYELWVRIYPDEVFVNSHEKAITHEEHDDVRTFWTEVWNAGGHKDKEIAAWRILALKHGVHRAAYLRQLLDPDRAQQSTVKKARAAYDIIAELESTGRHFSNLQSLELTGPDAINEILFVKDAINDCMAMQANFSEELTATLLEITETLHGVRLQTDTLMSRLNALPASQKTLAADFVFRMSELTGLMATFSEQLNNKTGLNEPLELSFWTVPNFPSSGVSFKDSSWSEPPKVKTLPERFVFLGMQDKTFSHLVVGKPVPDPLIVGIDPSDTDPSTFEYDEHGNLKVDDNILWMTDFDEAVKKGMGIIVPLSKLSRDKGFEKIMVIGVKGSTATEASGLLKELMEGHMYSPDGISLLPVGTPTNITENKTSGFSSEEDEVAAYERITGDPLFVIESDEKKISDGQRLTEALGLPGEMFSRTENSGRKDIYQALMMNKVMWPATLGYYLEEITDTMFTLDNYHRINDYFTKYVSGRGFLPAFRIAEQPYGILPVTAFSRFKTSASEFLPPLLGSDFTSLSKSALDAKLQLRFDIRLKNLLNAIRVQWMKIVEQEKLNIDDFDAQETTSQEHFMQLLGLQATSIEQYFRYNVNSAQRRMAAPSAVPGATVNFADEDIFGFTNMNKLFGQFIQQGYFIDDTYFDMNKMNRVKEARIFRLRYFDSFGQLDGPFVREDDGEFLKAADGKTYIDRLLGHTPYHLWQDGVYDGNPSNSLFFIFLRQALTAAYRDTALDILMTEGIINENTRRRAGTMGTYILPTPEKDVAFTRWNYLFSTADFIQSMVQVSPFKKFPLSNPDQQNAFWQYLMNQNWSMSDYLFKVTTDEQPMQRYSSSHNIDKVKEIRQLLKDINGMPVNELERLFAEHLDLCTYRFDAWQLGIANKRLHDLRSASGGGQGIYLGAYGWLENLTPLPEDDKKVATNVPPGLRENDGKTVYTNEENEGFIHAPSLTHAMTAAILRSGYIANKDSGDQTNPMAVNLTSRRVRMALKLLEGISNGQEAAAILGYQFERGLHEGYTSEGLELDAYIYDIRRKHPLHPDVDEENAPDPDEDRNLLNVVHGTGIIEKIRKVLAGQLNTDKSLYELQLETSNRNAVLQALGLSTGIPLKDAKAIFREVDRMADAFDALGDLLLSESVYHIAQGNHVRSAAVFAALSEGRVPREVSIINTPRTGHVLTQRMTLHFDALDAATLLPYGGLPENSRNTNIEEAKPEAWEDIPFSMRAFAEPSLNRWLGQIIGDPAAIRCYASWEADGSQQYMCISLKDLGLQPLDAVYLLGQADDENGHALNATVAHHVRKTAGLTVDVRLELFFRERNEHLLLDGESMSQDILTINEAMPLLRSLFDIISSARHTAADDYVVPGESVPENNDLKQYDLDEILQRILFTKEVLKSAHAGITALFNGKGADPNDLNSVAGKTYYSAEINNLRNYLNIYNGFGIPGCFPEYSVETTPEAGTAIAKMAAIASSAVAERIGKAESLLSSVAAATSQENVERIVSAAKEIFGRSFAVLPHFKLRNYNELNTILNLPADEGLMRNGDEYAMDSWFQGIAKVRKKVNTVEMASTMTTIFDREFPETTPLQLPYNTVTTDEGEEIPDYWLGIPYPDHYEPENDKLSLVVLGAHALTAGGADTMRCGLLLDEWIEVIPQREEDTGITFNYDQPDAEPPQSLLLAVTPVQTGKWDWNDLVFTLLETMDLYKARLIEPEQVDRSVFTQVLPAVMGETAPETRYRDTGTLPGVLELEKNNQS